MSVSDVTYQVADEIFPTVQYNSAALKSWKCRFLL